MNKETLILKDKLDTTLNILLELEFLKNNVDILSNNDSKYFSKVSQKSQFLHTTFQASFKLFIIEIYKLLDENSDYSINKTIKFCKTEIRKIEWESKPDIVFFEALERKLQIEESDLLKIKNLRNKFYAHSDKKRFKFPYEIERIKLWEILQNLQYIFRLICQEYNNYSWIFPIQHKGIPELKMISDYKDIRKLMLEKKSKSELYISIEELQKIIRG